MFDTKVVTQIRGANSCLYLYLCLLFVSFGQLWASDVKGLDTGDLAPWEFHGKAQKTASKAACEVRFTPMERDYAGRFFQLMELKVPARNTLDRTLELKQNSRLKSPSFLLSKRFFSFVFEMREVTKSISEESPYYKVEVIGEGSDPTKLNAVRVYRRSKVQQDDILMFDCVNLIRNRASNPLTSPSSASNP